MTAVRRLLLTTTCLLAVAAAPAQAGPLVASAPNCEEQVLEQPFLPWADPAHYTLVPGGTFEGALDGWSVGGASTAEGNEPFYVHGADEHLSLAVASRTVVTTATMCVGVEHPTLRLFTTGSGGLLSTLDVEVLFEDAGGSVHSLLIGTVAAGAWAPTVQMPIVANLLPLLPGERTPVAFRFTAKGGGDWRLDDVYVDPYRRN